MKKWLLIFLGVLSFSLWGQDVFTQQYLFFSGAPTFLNNGSMGLFNPANAQMNQFPETRLFFARYNAESTKNYHYGFAFGAKGIGFHYFQHKVNGKTVNDYQISFGDGNETFSWGTAYGWASGNRGIFHRRTYWGMGFIFRPAPMISISGSGFTPTKAKEWVGLFEVGIRPLKNETLTLVGNYMKNELNPAMDKRWGIGASIEVWDGLKLNGMYFDDQSIRVGVNFSIFGMFGVQTHQGTNDNGYQYGSYELRFGGGEKSAFYETIMKEKNIVKIHLKGNIDYQKYVLFDQQTIRFKDLLDKIEAATRSTQVKVLAFNLSGFRASSAIVWELREALKRAKHAGKKVVVYIDNPTIGSYYLASVSDLLVMDPLGIIVFNGLLFSKTYLKGTLEKLGLGVDEWRFFKYKSAYETLSRKDMSEADSIQLQEYLNDIYAEYRKGISEMRHFSKEHFDKLVNEEVLFLADDAKNMGLVDTLGRWVDIDQIIKEKFGKTYAPIPFKLVRQYENIDERWSEEPKIAIVYALGPCALDEGIRARFLEKVFDKLKKDKSVKAIVFRVDSPGGDALASDLVTEAIKKVKKVKPVIVSQGFVAGSGGYWISMAGNKILATPFTITGSIGVIGGWIYDQGLTGKLGLTADKVQVGKHADLGFGPTIPFLNATVPYRNLTPDERNKVKQMFLKMYGQFVKKVAVNRNLTEDFVRKIAEGHIYSGIDGKDIKLVDEIGDLHAAIEEAKKLAHISEDTPVDIIEIPKYKGLFNMPSSPLGIKAENTTNDAARYYIMHMANRPLIPLPMTPVAFWDLRMF